MLEGPLLLETTDPEIRQQKSEESPWGACTEELTVQEACFKQQTLPEVVVP